MLWLSERWKITSEFSWASWKRDWQWPTLGRASPMQHTQHFPVWGNFPPPDIIFPSHWDEGFCAPGGPFFRSLWANCIWQKEKSATSGLMNLPSGRSRPSASFLHVCATERGSVGRSARDPTVAEIRPSLNYNCRCVCCGLRWGSENRKCKWINFLTVWCWDAANNYGFSLLVSRL